MIVQLAMFLLVPLISAFFWYQASRHLKAQQKSWQWQQEKMRRFAEGWRPSLWDDDASNEDKLNAIIRYIDGEM